LACREGFCATALLAGSLRGSAAGRRGRFGKSAAAGEPGLAGLAIVPAAFRAAEAAGDKAAEGGFAGVAIAPVAVGAFAAFGAAGAEAGGAAGNGGGIAAVATGSSAARAIVGTPSIDSSTTIGKSPVNLAIRDFPPSQDSEIPIIRIARRKCPCHNEGRHTKRPPQ